MSRRLIIFGAGFWGEMAFSYLGGDNIYCFCDNKLQGNEEGRLNEKKIISFQKLMEIQKDYNIVISAGSNYNTEIGRQLDEAGIEDYFYYDVLQEMPITMESFMEQLQGVNEREKLFKIYYKTLADRTKRQLEYLKCHADIMTLKPAKGAMRKEQIKLLDFAEEFFEFIDKLEIRPFLVFGNLIGAFRHKGFVPWDDDLDFGLTRGELDKLLAFAEENCVVGTHCREVWVDRTGKEILWKDIFQVYPEQYIFDIRSNMIHVYKSTYGSIWKPGMDIWVFDFYKDEYLMTEHRKWLEEIGVRLQEMKDERDKVLFLKAERENNPMVSMEMTDNFFPGIDQLGGYPGRKDITEWISSKDIFPLRKAVYENTEFWVPNKMEALLSWEYPDYMSFPYDVGCPIHIGMDEAE